MTAEVERKVIGPHPGPQTKLLSSNADIAFYGGAAGGGKTFALLLDPLRYIHIPNFQAVIFRRTAEQVRTAGGLWDESCGLYPLIGGRGRENTLDWRWGNGATVRFEQMQHEATKHEYMGAQITMLGFDELTHFCVTPDTDVLTETGWRPIADILIGDRVASLTRDRQIIFGAVVATHVSRVDGDLIECDQRKGVSFCVTPNHRMVVNRQDKAGSWGFLRADHCEKTTQVIPRTGEWSGIEVESVKLPRVSGRGIGKNSLQVDSVAADDYLEFLGWYLSEGSAFFINKRKSSPCVSIRQTKANDGLLSLMERLPWKWRPDGDGGYRIYNRQLFEHVKPLGNRFEKRIPRWVMGLSRRQQMILLNAFLQGDGGLQKTGAWAVGLCNEGLIDDLQEMAVYCGHVATKGFQVVEGGFKVYRLNINAGRQATQINVGDCSRIEYHGSVHCLTVEGGNFMMRRHGRFCWTGNSESQFFYLLSRNRSTCGVKPYVRATCNPDSRSWVAKLIAWWIDQDSGYAIADRSGVKRWFVRDQDQLKWGDSRAEMLERYPGQAPKSLTFVPARLDDNPTLLRIDPNYRANLMMLPRVERERLLGGNWKTSESTLIDDANLRRYTRNGDLMVCTVSGKQFVISPAQCRRFATIDTAGTSREKAEEQKGKPPSWSVCEVWDYYHAADLLFLAYVWRDRVSWGDLKAGVRRTLEENRVTRAYLENAHHAPALKEELRGIQCEMVGPVIEGMTESHRGAKLERAIASGMLSRIEDHRLLIPDDERPWIRTYRDELTSWGGLPDETADQIDCTSYASYVCRRLVSSWGGTINTRGMART